jgi:prepilin-type N-terminal cleavage/methylation domain-containing protein
MRLNDFILTQPHGTSAASGGRVQKRTDSGYSLAEMLVVIAIVGIMSLVSVPMFMSFFQSMKIKSSMRQFTNDLRSARQKAITENQPFLVSFDTGGLGANSYKTYRMIISSGAVTYDQTNLPATQKLDPAVYFYVPAGTTCLVPDAITPPSSPSGWNDIVFMPNGTVQYIPSIPALPIPSITFSNPATPACAAGQVFMKIDAKVARPTYTVNLYPNGAIKVN